MNFATTTTGRVSSDACTVKPINVTDLASVSLSLPDLPPDDRRNDAEMDPFFIEELNKLSMKERDEVLQDVHGVSDVMNENPVTIQAKVVQMQQALDQLPLKQKAAYLQALQQNEHYVHNPKFLLMFLRADAFNVEASALRFVSFFEHKLQLFGRDKLARDILFCDLTEGDIACLESGYAQMLSGRDRAGRAVLCLLPMLRKYKSTENRLRAIYMVIMFALRDVETQKRGMVGIAYNVGRDHTTDREAVWKAAKIVSILPLRFTGVHYCFDDERVKTLFNLAMYVFNRNARMRCRVHCGSHMECIYHLMTFGIKSSDFPITTSGEKRLEAHHDYVRKMRQSENIMDDGVDRIIIPGPLDVLLGRGKPLQKHDGNLNYHFVVEGYHERYEQASKLEKTQIAKTIVDKIHEQGGRFLKQDDAGWVEIDDEAARTKISHTFRNHRIAARTALKKAASTQEKEVETAPVDLRRRSPDLVSFQSGNCNSLELGDQKRRKVSG
ncbi:hypothetical protein IV203_004438 [Nitzschia inconspicua]|uniref:DUF6824 domain-containing protein n=1 Tax=Nitzschia inconspicua TaxID=303405 RepID=A0A9K3L427_9STRA|nr:hypothetical protein IV203_004438 [Nitzschia inconspicua]